MTITQIIGTFTYYGADVTILAAVTGILTQIIKKLFFKGGCKKVVTFIPFIIGIALYCAYKTAVTLDASYPIREWADVFEGGTSVGAIATIMYVLYEQFVREKDLSAAAAVISNLISGYVVEGSEDETAKLVASAIERDVTGNAAKKAMEIIAEQRRESVSDKDLYALSYLIVQTLARMR